MYRRKVFERYLTLQEERRLLKHIAQFADLYAQRDHAWMRYARQTGVRVGVLAGMTVSDARQALKSGYLFVRGEINKGGTSYTVFQTRKARQALRDLLRIRRELGHAEDPDAPLIVSRHRRGLSVRSFESRMKKWVRSAGLNVEASPHWWRHTKAIRIRTQSSAPDPVEAAQHALGQSCRKSAEQYSYPTREEMEQYHEEAS